MRLIYSPDENGWYWERRDWKTSQLFPTEEAARLALRQGACVWAD